MSGNRPLGYYLIFISFAGSMSAPNELMLRKQPFGIIMCMEVCQRVSGCHVLKYIHLHLSCHIGEMKYETGMGKQVLGIFNISKERTMKCSPGDIITRSRIQGFQCVKYSYSNNTVRRAHTDLQHRFSPRTHNDYLKMSSDTHKVCQKLYQLCDKDKKKRAKEQLFKLCAQLKDVTHIKELSPLIWFVPDKRCNLSRFDFGNITILHRAAQIGLLKMVQCVLTKHQISTDCRDSNGTTPLMLAARYGHVNVFRLLLNSGSELSKVDQNGDSVLHFACKGGSLTIVKDIVKADSASLHCKSKRGFTPMMTAVDHDQMDIVKFLLKKRSEANVADRDGCNLLHIAAIQGHVDVVKYILDNHIADIDSTNKPGWTALMMAVWYCRRKVFHFLLGQNASVHGANKNGNSLLHIACKRGDIEIVKTLLKYVRKDVWKKRNDNGKTPLDLAGKGIREHLINRR